MPAADAATLTAAPTDRRRILWTYLITIAGFHTLALLALVPWLFSWTGLIAMVVGVHVFGQGINIGYHRMLSHRSFQARPWVERSLVILGLCCFEDTPLRWVANHRCHHKHSDEEPDPHSPIVSFLWAHVGWLIFRNSHLHNISAYQQYAPDLIRDPFYLKLEKQPWIGPTIYLGHALLFFAVAFAVGYATAAPEAAPLLAGTQFGLSVLVWGVIVRTVVVWHITWSVNSLTHLRGYRNHETPEHSRNNWLVALFTVGEGWHNNHHHDPASASNQHRWWELDISYYQIKLLQRLGLASKVREPRHRRRAAD